MFCPKKLIRWQNMVRFSLHLLLPIKSVLFAVAIWRMKSVSLSLLFYSIHRFIFLSLSLPLWLPFSLKAPLNMKLYVINLSLVWSSVPPVGWPKYFAKDLPAISLMSVCLHSFSACRFLLNKPKRKKQGIANEESLLWCFKEKKTRVPLIQVITSKT